VALTSSALLILRNLAGAIFIPAIPNALRRRGESMPTP